MTIEERKIYNKEYRKTYKRKSRKGSESVKAYNCLHKRGDNKEYCREYYSRNKEKMNEQMVDYITNRRKTDPLFRLQTLIGNRIRESMRGRKGRGTCSILGCSYEEFKKHIESKWQSWMNWGNYGRYNGEERFGWDLDHVIAVSTAKTTEELEKLNHYTNFQPLCSKENRVVKRNK